MEEIKFDIIDYMGKLLDDAVLIKLAICYQEKYYDAIFYYKGEKVTLTVDEKLEKKLGSVIERWEGYVDLMYAIIEKLPPYQDILRQVDFIYWEDIT